MYMDSIVAYGMVIVLLTCAVITYVGVYAYKRIKEDSARVDSELKKQA